MAAMEGSLTLKNPSKELFFFPFVTNGLGERGDRGDRGDRNAGDRGPLENISEGGGEVKFVANVSPVAAVPTVLVDCREPVVEVSIVEFRYDSLGILGWEFG
jgi:hypothetical protein